MVTARRPIKQKKLRYKTIIYSGTLCVVMSIKKVSGSRDTWIEWDII